MVPHSSYSQCLHAIGAGDPTHVGPEFGLQLIRYQGPSFMRGKDVMHQDARV